MPPDFTSETHRLQAGCQRIFKADGKIHVFVPIKSGTNYNSEYSLASGHPFFAKSLRDALVVPNKVFVRSLKDAAASVEGSATSAVSYALLPVNDYQRAAVDSSTQADSIAAAIISRLEINAQQGGASVPVNCGTELYDYVKVTDERESDYRVGNVGTISRVYRNYPGRKPEYSMSFSFGRVALKSVRGTRQSNLTSRGLLRRESDGSIPWDELYNEIVEIEYNLHDINIALGWHEAETDAEKVIQAALAGYLKNVVEDTTPQLGGDLDANNKKIKSLATPINENDAATKEYVDDKAGITDIVQDTSPQLGGDLDTNNKEIKSISSAINIDGYSGIMLKLSGDWRISIGSNTSIKSLTTFYNDVTSSRALNTTYINETGSPLFVTVICDIGIADYGQLYLKIGSSDPPTIPIDGMFFYSPDTDIATYTVKGIVPMVSRYRVQSVGDVTIYKWIETKIGQ